MIPSIKRCFNYANNLSSVKKRDKPKDNHFHLIISEESIDLSDDGENRGRKFYSKISTCKQEVEHSDRDHVLNYCLKIK